MSDNVELTECGLSLMIDCGVIPRRFSECDLRNWAAGRTGALPPAYHEVVGIIRLLARIAIAYLDEGRERGHIAPRALPPRSEPATEEGVSQSRTLLCGCAFNDAGERVQTCGGLPGRN